MRQGSSPCFKTPVYYSALPLPSAQVPLGSLGEMWSFQKPCSSRRSGVPPRLHEKDADHALPLLLTPATSWAGGFCFSVRADKLAQKEAQSHSSLRLPKLSFLEGPKPRRS